MKTIKKNLEKNIERHITKEKEAFIKKVANKMQFNKESGRFEVDNMEELEKFIPKEKKTTLSNDPRIRDIVAYLCGIMTIIIFIIIIKSMGYTI